MYGYKVVRKSENLLLSATWWDSAAIIYSLEQKTYPHKNYGPLCVFDSLNNALGFTSNLQDIYFCEFAPSKHRLIWIPPKSLPYNSLKLPKTPIGTMLADWVLLIQEAKL